MIGLFIYVTLHWKRRNIKAEDDHLTNYKTLKLHMNPVNRSKHQTEFCHIYMKLVSPSDIRMRFYMNVKNSVILLLFWEAIMLQSYIVLSLIIFSF